MLDVHDNSCKIKLKLGVSENYLIVFIKQILLKKLKLYRRKKFNLGAKCFIYL